MRDFIRGCVLSCGSKPGSPSGSLCLAYFFCVVKSLLTLGNGAGKFNITFYKAVNLTLGNA